MRSRRPRARDAHGAGGRAARLVPPGRRPGAPVRRPARASRLGAGAAGRPRRPRTEDRLMNRCLPAAVLAAAALALPAAASATEWHAPFLVHLHGEHITTWRVN